MYSIIICIIQMHNVHGINLLLLRLRVRVFHLHIFNMQTCQTNSECECKILFDQNHLLHNIQMLCGRNSLEHSENGNRPTLMSC